MVEWGVLSLPRNLKRPKLGMSCSRVTVATERTLTETSSFSKVPAEVVSCSGHSPVVWEEEEWWEADWEWEASVAEAGMEHNRPVTPHMKKVKTTNGTKLLSVNWNLWSIWRVGAVTSLLLLFISLNLFRRNVQQTWYHSYHAEGIQMVRDDPFP